MLKKIINCRSKFLHYTRSTSSLTDTVSGDVDKSIKKLPEKPSFIKNLLVGKYDEAFLIYPELKLENLKAIENKYLRLPKIQLSSKEFLKQYIHEIENNNINEGNIDKRMFELTRLSEAIPSMPMSLILEIRRICIYEIILKYCSEEQKKKYMPGLLSGETSVAFALSEEISGSDPSCINTTAVRDSKSSIWSLNGIKPWVTNGECADLFIVFSKVKLHSKSPGSSDLSVFLVDKKLDGLSVEKIPSYGLEECGLSKLILNNVSLRDEDILSTRGNGYKIAIELLNSYKYSLSSCFSNHLKFLLNETVKFISPRKQTLVNLKDCELIRKKISDVFLTIYTLDSMLYLTAGMLDNYQIEMTIESAVIHLFCFQNGMSAVENCLEILGSQVYNNSSPYSQLRKDLKAVSAALFSKDICKLFIALTGIQYAVGMMGNDVHKLRNSFNNPLFFFKKVISDRRNSNDSPKLNLNLYMNLHPSLQTSGEQLEYCVLRLHYCIEKLLVRHGSEISNRQLDLEKLSDIIVDIYGMTAVLGRASRSYCTGIKFADDEILLAKIFCQDASTRCKFSINSMLEDTSMANDLFHLKLGDHLIQHGSYFIEHPLTQNIG